MTSDPPLICLFDLDGTLTDPFPGISRSIAHALRELEVPVPGDDALRSWIGPPLLESFRQYFREMNLDRSESRALSLYRERFAAQGLYENSVYEGVPELLESLVTRGRRLFLATAKPLVFARKILEHFDLDRYFEASHGSELDGARTDKIELLTYIAETERLDLRGGAMIGDRHHDMTAACYHGMNAIGVRWGYGSERELLDAGAGQLVSGPRQLRRALLGHPGS